MSGQTIAVFGGSFNPPCRHHLAVVEQLCERFDRVVVLPCGPRPDKPITDDVEPVYRATMVDMVFQGLGRVEVDLSDLEASTFTRTWDLQERFSSEGEVYHVVGTDLVQGGKTGQSVIHREWYRGEELWAGCRFAVVDRPGFEIDPDDLPPLHVRIPACAAGSSSAVREAVFQRRDVSTQLVARVLDYIQRHNLYRGTHASRSTRLELADIRCRLHYDPWNDKARELAAGTEESPDPNLILVFGGDGTMLRAIRSHWRNRLPFFGVNSGHLGFLLNQQHPSGYLGQQVACEHLPLLWVECEADTGERSQALAFNDAWVERATGQTAWIRVEVDGQIRLERLISDGALVSTAAGSTSYARAMGASPMPLNTPALLLVGSNVLQPAFWRPAVLPDSASIALTTLDPDKRPLRAYIDGVDQGLVRSLRARVSRIASVELAFDPHRDPAEKLARIQFPLREE
ncbi:MAG: NAD(+)/NADH kinase [Deltaproteobacteria bacterium]|nr:NAD(+)/NADH kinase [Deltaproteobacteria bacterium]